VDDEKYEAKKMNRGTRFIMEFLKKKNSRELATEALLFAFFRRGLFLLMRLLLTW
jgi:hypothetical protein